MYIRGISIFRDALQKPKKKTKKKSLPDLSLSRKENLRATGTNGMVVETSSSAYKKLEKNPYLDSPQPSSIGTKDESKSPDNGDGKSSHKPLAVTTLGTEKTLMSSGDITSKGDVSMTAQNSAQRIQ